MYAWLRGNAMPGYAGTVPASVIARHILKPNPGGLLEMN